MNTFNAKAAYELIKAGVESKAITLQGSAGTETGAEEGAKRDAKYLLTLFTELSKKPAE